jgi:hypothetical protein
MALKTNVLVLDSRDEAVEIEVINSRVSAIKERSS